MSAPERLRREGDSQPMPRKGAAGPAVQDLVMRDLADRKALGIRRYGTPLQAHNGRSAERDAYEETLDLACYLRQILEEGKALDFVTLRQVNVERCDTAFHPLEGWAPVEWSNALAGEAGEVCNAVKKLRRIEDGTQAAKDPQTREECIAQISDELADVIAYADLLAARLGIDLGAAVARKFNAVSDRVGSACKLPEGAKPCFLRGDRAARTISRLRGRLNIFRLVGALVRAVCSPRFGPNTTFAEWLDAQPAEIRERIFPLDKSPRL